MEDTNEFKKTLSMVLVGIMISSTIPINVMANDRDTIAKILSKDIITSGSIASVPENNIDVDYNITGQWNGGFNGEIAVTNPTDRVIENWQIQMEFPQEITDIWNATIVSHEGSIYNIKNAGGNNNVSIPANGSVTFGFSGTYEGDIIAPKNVQLVKGKITADEKAYTIEYNLLSDWGDGYSSQITINNNTNNPMEAWQFEFDFDREIDNIWNAVIEKYENGKYFIVNAGYNSVIPANGSVSFGFNGGGGKSSGEPYNYILKYSSDKDSQPNLKPDITTDIDETKDTDEDGVPDYIEEFFGTRLDIADTDGDGLSDYIEIFEVDTDPLVVDTDNNLVDDGYEDYDGDGLTNLEELALGTKLFKVDTDSDGLSDYEEVKNYHTDPLKYDTDNDTVGDGDGIKLGLNPNRDDTDNDGTKDCYEKITQTISEDIVCNELPGITKVSVTLDVSGVIDDCVEINNMYNKNVLSTDIVGITGSPMDISCTQEFESAKITFTYDANKLNIAPTNLGILWYNEDEQFYEVMDSELDETNHTISITTPHFSEYTVVDLNKWFKAWEEKINYGDTSITEKNSDWGGKVVTPQQLCDEYNQYFGFDDAVTLNNVLGACESGDIYALLGKITLAINNGEVIDYPCLFMSLKEIYQVGFAVDKINAVFPVPVNGGWVVSYINGYINYEFPHYNDLGNIWPLKSDVISYSGVLYDDKKFFIPSGQVDTTDNDKDGLYDIYELTGMRIANGQVIYTKTNNPDSDGDILKDGEEIIRQDTERGYFVIKSNPLSGDWDYDGRCDDIDEKPFSNLICGNLYTEYSKNPTISFNMDYRNFFADNEVYNQILSTASVLLSSAVYHENHIDVAQHDDGGNETKVKTKDIKELLTYLGFSGSETYSLENLYTDEHLSEVALGYRNVSYNGEDKTILAVIIRGTNSTIEEWSSNFYIGCLDDFDSLVDWKNIDNHAGFDIAANRIKDIIELYVKVNDLENKNITYWITGHSRGAAIANIIGANFEKSGKRSFTYTFAAPNTTLEKDVDTYRSIFNIVNEDDFVPELPPTDWGYSRYGRTTNNLGVSSKYEKEFRNLTNVSYKSNTKKVNNVVTEMATIIPDKADPRKACYKYTCSCHGDGSDNSIIEYAATPVPIYIPDNAIPYCYLYEPTDNEDTYYDYKLCQTPACFMQLLADVMAKNFWGKVSFTFQANAAPKYVSSKAKLIGAHSYLQTPHYTESYYILSKHIEEGDFS